MRILNINSLYGEGSTGKIVEEIHKRLERDGHSSYVVYGLGNIPKVNTERIYKMTSNFLAKQYGRLARIIGLRYNCAYFETIRLILHIKKINPEIVHIHCMNCSYINPYILLKWLGKHNYNVLITHHADVTITANCDHAYECEHWKSGCINHCKTLKKEQHLIFSNARLSWLQMKHSFEKIKYLYASGVSPWMVNRVKLSPFFKDRECRVIENGIDVSSFKYDESNINVFFEKYKKKGTKIVLHVTPSILQPLKGSKYVFELAKRMTNVQFVIVGFKNEHIPILYDNLILIPHINSKRELASFYQNADVTILTSKRESFSLVTVESLSCGTPVVGFLAGAPETIAIPEYSAFVEYGDVDSLQNQLENYLIRKFDKPLISEIARKRYDAEIMYKNYLAYYNDIVRYCNN